MWFLKGILLLILIYCFCAHLLTLSLIKYISGPYPWYTTHEQVQDDFERQYSIRKQLQHLHNERWGFGPWWVKLSPDPMFEEIEIDPNTVYSIRGWEWHWGQNLMCGNYIMGRPISFEAYWGIFIFSLFIWALTMLMLYLRWLRIRFVLAGLASVLMLHSFLLVIASSLPRLEALPEPAKIEGQLSAQTDLLQQKIRNCPASLLDIITLDGKAYPLFIAPSDIFGVDYVRIKLDPFAYYFYGPALDLEKQHRLNPTMEYRQAGPHLFAGSYPDLRERCVSALSFRIVDIIFLPLGVAALWWVAWKRRLKRPAGNGEISGK